MYNRKPTYSPSPATVERIHGVWSLLWRGQPISRHSCEARAYKALNRLLTASAVDCGVVL